MSISGLFKYNVNISSEHTVRRPFLSNNTDLDDKILYSDGSKFSSNHIVINSDIMVNNIDKSLLMSKINVNDNGEDTQYHIYTGDFNSSTVTTCQNTYDGTSNDGVTRYINVPPGNALTIACTGGGGAGGAGGGSYITLWPFTNVGGAGGGAGTAYVSGLTIYGDTFYLSIEQIGKAGVGVDNSNSKGGDGGTTTCKLGISDTITSANIALSGYGGAGGSTANTSEDVSGPADAGAGGGGLVSSSALSRSYNPFVIYTEGALSGQTPGEKLSIKLPYLKYEDGEITDDSLAGGSDQGSVYRGGNSLYGSGGWWSHTDVDIGYSDVIKETKAGTGNAGSGYGGGGGGGAGPKSYNSEGGNGSPGCIKIYYNSTGSTISPDTTTPTTSTIKKEYSCGCITYTNGEERYCLWNDDGSGRCQRLTFDQLG